MASKLEVTLCAKMDERERREIAMRNTLANIRDLDLACSRRLLVHQCLAWMEAHEECNEAARQLSDSAELEVAAPVEMFRGRAVAV
jgi:hypothetical protein